MNKTKQVNFLEEELEKQIKDYLINEANYRAVTSIIMAERKPDDKLLAAQTNAKALKEGYELKIRQLKQIIQEVKDGRLEI